MRDIKFRVWDKLKKEFISDYYYKKEFIKIALNLGSCVCVDPDELVLQQYTGLKDKNGKEVYEGDIVKVGFGEHTGSLGKVIFEYCTFMLESKYGAIFQDTIKSCQYGEVMGNIFENPELIKNEI